MQDPLGGLYMSEARDEDLALKIGPMPSIDSPIVSWAAYYRPLG